MTSAASAGGSGGARVAAWRIGCFAWAATYLVAEQTLSYDLVPGRLVCIGDQTGRLDLIRLVVTRANGHPTLADYLPYDALPDDSIGCCG